MEPSDTIVVKPCQPKPLKRSGKAWIVRKRSHVLVLSLPLPSTRAVSLQERYHSAGGTPDGLLLNTKSRGPEKGSEGDHSHVPKATALTARLTDLLEAGIAVQASKATRSPIANPEKAKKTGGDNRRTQGEIREELGLSKEGFRRLTNKITAKLEEKGLFGNLDFRLTTDLGCQSDHAWLKIVLRGVRDECISDMDDELSLERIDKCLWERVIYLNTRENKPWHKKRNAEPEKEPEEEPEKPKRAKKVKQTPSLHSQMWMLTNEDARLQRELNDNADRQAKELEKGEHDQDWMKSLQARAARIAESRKKAKIRMDRVMEMMCMEEQEEWFKHLDN